MKQYCVLIIGSGGREHALSLKISQSSLCKWLYVLPGNYGISILDRTTCLNKGGNELESVMHIINEHKIDFVVIGPEQPLANGFVDHIESCTTAKCFGPRKAGALLESEKSFSKEFMQKNKISTAKFSVFSDISQATELVQNSDENSFVVKADGLAGGKGVVIAENKNECLDALTDMLVNRKFGEAGSTVIIEEKLCGPEISCLAFVDSNLNYALMPASQDHKRAYDNDKGPNTGGMGAYAPCFLATPEILQDIRTKVFDRVMQGLRNEAIPYTGVLYAGIMLTQNGPHVLEFNCRFGDPETQVILPLLRSDLLSIMVHCVNGTLNQIMPLEWKSNTFACGITIAAKDYPLISPCQNLEIKKMPKTIEFSGNTKSQANGDDIINGVNDSPTITKFEQYIFDAGTVYDSNLNVRVTQGLGRIFTCVGISNHSLHIATGLAYALCPHFNFIALLSDSKTEFCKNDYKNTKQPSLEYFYRTDIAKSGLQYEKNYKKLNQENQINPNGAYTLSGVDIGKTDAFLAEIGSLVKQGHRPEVLSSIGGFYAAFDVGPLLLANNGNIINTKTGRYKNPVLITSTDGVGSKLKIAIDYGRASYISLGIDLVAMTVNDILTSGAECLFFLDYIAVQSLDPERAKQIIEGIVQACKLANCSLIGGETAELPSLYTRPGDFDLAGFGVGIVDKEHMLPQKTGKYEINPGDLVIGLASNGFHSNGFSLVTKVFEQQFGPLWYNVMCPWDEKFDSQTTLGETLLRPTVIYHPFVYPLLEKFNFSAQRNSEHMKTPILAMAHITGGGLIDNLPRVLPQGLTCHFNARNWHIPPCFSWLYYLSHQHNNINSNDGKKCVPPITLHEMGHVFNLGIGYVLIVRNISLLKESNGNYISDSGQICNNSVVPKKLHPITQLLNASGCQAWEIGTVVEGNHVRIDNLEECLHTSFLNLSSLDNWKLNNINYINNNDTVINGYHFNNNNINNEIINENNLNVHYSEQLTRKINVGILISNTGSNMKALIDYCKSNADTYYKIGLVISNKSTALGLNIARESGIETLVISSKDFSDKSTFENAIDKALRKHGIEFICLAGFMRILSGDFVRRWEHRIINVHPSLLPSFKGMDAVKQALEAGCIYTGSTIHYVQAQVDSGEIIAQTPVEILTTDTHETLTERIKCAEHKMYPKTLDSLCKRLISEPKTFQ